jgi:hypothetical protein
MATVEERVTFYLNRCREGQFLLVQLWCTVHGPPQRQHQPAGIRGKTGNTTIVKNVFENALFKKYIFLRVQFEGKLTLDVTPNINDSLFILTGSFVLKSHGQTGTRFYSAFWGYLSLSLF